MPLDSIYLSALAEELKGRLEGGRIDKVQQPSREMILISVRSKGSNLKLLVAVGNGNARIQITDSSFENPTEAPMFCMLLRKHLLGAHIISVSQPLNERVLILDLAVRDEMGFESRKKLITELIGRSSNLVLVDSESRIIDCIRRMDYGGDATRRLLPGMIYRLPPEQKKVAFLSTNSDERRILITEADKSKPVDKWLLDSFSGLSPLVCRELAFRSDNDFDTLPELLDAFCDSIFAGELKPIIIYDGIKPIDFCFMPICQYGREIFCEEQESFSSLLDVFYSQTDLREQRRRRAQELIKAVRTARDRQQKKLILQREELKRTEDRENIRKKAELITANIYRLKKGDRILACQDYYLESCPEVEIDLNPLKSPQENAAVLFKEYNKMKAARDHLTFLLEDGEKRLEYLNSVLENIQIAESEKDLSDIRRELVETGYLRINKNKKQEKIKIQGPIRFFSDDGTEILVGRNNIQNDELSTKVGRRTDYWMHTQGIHGSHVIIRCNDTSPSEIALNQAAIIAAYYSQGRDSGKIPVDYTMLKNVRKPSGALPGKVIYTDYKTLFVQADVILIKHLKV